MRDSIIISPSVGESKELEQKQCNVRRVRLTLHDNEKRVPITIRMRDSVHTAVARHCGGSGIRIGQFYESSVILSMEVDPVEFSPIMVTMPAQPRQIDLRVKVQELICIDDLNLFIGDVDELDHSNVVMMQSKKRKLAKILKECYKIKEWNEEISELAEKAMSYFG